MATFQVNTLDQENTLSNALKLKETGKPLQRRSVLGVIDPNKPDINKKPVLQKPKLVIYEDKDVSKALKNVKLEIKEEKKVALKERVPLAKISENQVVKEHNLEEPMSECSLNLSPLELSPSKLTLSNESAKFENLLRCVDYRDDIYNYLRKLEIKFKPKSFYMRRQPDITYPMRRILVDWMVEVAEEYKLHNETLYMAVSYVDRFLSSMAVVRGKLQLLGSSAIFIASKYEEIYPPDVGEFSYITDDTYTVKQVLKMEQLILKTLAFDLSGPTVHTFLMHLSIVGELPESVTLLAMYICELTILEGDPYLQYAPSLIACSAIALAKHCLYHADVWPASLAKISSYSLSALAPVVTHLNETHSEAATSQQAAIRERYKKKKFLNVSSIKPRPLHLREPEQ